MSSVGSDWSRLEVEATVADYFDMFAKELQGEPYSKTEHRRALIGRLGGRSEGAIEYKHQNISAVLIDLGHPYIDGYKPQSNYQELLRRVVEERLSASEELSRVVAAEVERSAEVPTVDDILACLVSPPPRQTGRKYGAVRERRVPSAKSSNYLLREARNAALGSAGEMFVVNFEQARLIAANQERLASNVEHVARTRGDHEGYDILSFDTGGAERLIEVKTTAFGAHTPFFVSANQLERSRELEDRYHVYRLFRFRKDPRLFSLPGSIESNCNLDATEFLARLD